MPTADTLRRQALDLYKEAAETEPDNMLVAMRLGNARERVGAWQDAIAVYKHAATKWPHAFEPLYRLAAVESFASSWAGGIGGHDSTSAVTERVRSQLGHSIEHWEQLIEASRWATRVRILLGNPVDEGRFFWRDVLIGFGPRVRRRKLCQLALVSTEVQRARHTQTAPQAYEVAAKAMSRVKRLRRGLGGRHWQVRYNAACCYARIFETTFGLDEVNAEALRSSVELAHRALIDSEGALSRSWVERGDPDLARVRDTAEFKAQFPSAVEERSASRGSAALHLVPHAGRWALRRERSPWILATFDRKSDALAAARDRAKSEKIVFIVHLADGRISERIDYRDPPPTS